MITFTVPLPPPSLRSNSRAHWRTKVNAKQGYSRAVWGWWHVAHDISPQNYQSDLPWARAKVTYCWKYAGVAPDISNLGANTKALQDILCMAPRSPQRNDTTYLGLVEDDKGIVPVYELEKVARRAAECVVVTIEEIHEGAATEQMREVAEATRELREAR